jgi:predicted amidohydrolase YtcJ
MEISRRSLLEATAAAVVAPTVSYRQQQPDNILYNGNIWTGMPNMPEAQAIAMAGDRIVAVGPNAMVAALAGPLTRKIDLGGARVTPGFYDAHAHPVDSGIDLLLNVDCESNSLDEIKKRLRQRTQSTAPGAWVRGFLYDDGKTPRPLDVHDLDDVSIAHPIIVIHRGGHTAFVNSAALSLVGISQTSPDPMGGRHFRDTNGKLNGRLGDTGMDAAYAMSRAVPTRQNYAEAAQLISRKFAAKGVTSAVDAACSAEGVQGYYDALLEGKLVGRFVCNILVDHIERFMATGIHTGFGNDWVRIGAQKQFADGSISERTAWLSSPYNDMDGKFSGLQTAPKDELYEKARRAHVAGWQIGIHANGDLAIDQVLGIFERLQAESPRKDPRFRIEHCTLVNSSLVKRIKAVGAIPVPFACYALFHGDVMHFYGEKRTQNMFAMRSFLDAGIPVPSASDYTASPSEPALWLQSQTTRTDPQGNIWGANQRITLQEALVCGTHNGAYSSFEEDRKGVLEPGKLADLVVWDRDLMHTPFGELKSVGVQRTMIGGKWVFEA